MEKKVYYIEYFHGGTYTEDLMWVDEHYFKCYREASMYLLNKGYCIDTLFGSDLLTPECNVDFYYQFAEGEERYANINILEPFSSECDKL